MVKDEFQKQKENLKKKIKTQLSAKAKSQKEKIEEKRCNISS